MVVIRASSLVSGGPPQKAGLQKLVPADRGLVEIDEHLFGFEVFLEAPGTEFASKARLLVTAPGGFDVGWLHVIDPDDAGTQGLDDTKAFVNVAGPDRGAAPLVRAVLAANRS